MEQFLQSSAEVMNAYLSGAAPVLLEHARRPLLGSIVSWSEEEELLSTRVLTLDEDLYLRHHTLGRTVSRTDPGLAALAVMPLAMSIEILAEAGACLFPGRVVRGLREVRAHRWLAVGEEPKTIQVHARRLPSEGDVHRVEVTLSEIDGAGAAAPVVEGIVLLGEDFQAAPAPLQPSLAGGAPSRWAPADLYGEAMFHQPLWQGVAAVDVVAAAGAQARLRVRPRAGMLAGNDGPAFVLDPVVLDAAGQLIGFWAAQRLERGKVVFPFRLAALDVYGPTPPVGELLDCRAAIALEGDQLVRSDIDVSDPDGRCWMRLSSWEDKRFDVPARFLPLSLPGELTPLSDRWDAPLAPYRGLAGSLVSCRRLDARLGADSALWKQVWALRVLSRRERALFDALKLPEGRRLEWLAARTAAKEAVAELVTAACGTVLWPAEIEILPDEQGAPVVALPPIEGLAEVAIVSIAHTHGEAVALAALVSESERGGLGIDIEEVRPRPDGFAQAALTAAERKLLAPLAASEVEEWLLRCWCAKEAAGKATGRGLSSGPQRPVIAAIEAAGERVLVDAGGTRMTVHTRREGSLVLATRIGEQAGGER
jgi:phosphopantetheinyl transferase (holo-ACP synthase)